MKTTHQTLKEIREANPTIMYFLLRLYENVKGLKAIEDDAFRYEWVNAESIDTIAEMIDKYEGEGWSVGLTSIVMTTGGLQYLLMLDYLVDHSTKAEGDLLWKLSAFNQSGDVNYRLDGWLIRTNNSYHYLGKYATSEENFINFLGSALLFRHSDENFFVIDDIWLGRSVKRRFGTIRIGKKEGMLPEIIGEVK